MRFRQSSLLRCCYRRKAEICFRLIIRTLGASSESGLFPPSTPTPPPPPPHPSLTLPHLDVEYHFPEERSDALSSRVERLPKGQPVVSAFQSWMGDGFPIHRGDIFHAINRLRKLRMNKRALEVKLASSHRVNLWLVRSPRVICSLVFVVQVVGFSLLTPGFLGFQHLLAVIMSLDCVI